MLLKKDNKRECELFVLTFPKKAARSAVLFYDGKAQLRDHQFFFQTPVPTQRAGERGKKPERNLSVMRDFETTAANGQLFLVVHKKIIRPKNQKLISLLSESDRSEIVLLIFFF